MNTATDNVNISLHSQKLQHHDTSVLVQYRNYQYVHTDWSTLYPV